MLKSLEDDSFLKLTFLDTFGTEGTEGLNRVCSASKA